MLKEYRSPAVALFLSLCVCLLLVLSSCGKTGELYLPDDKPGQTASTKK